MVHSSIAPIVLLLSFINTSRCEAANMQNSSSEVDKKVLSLLTILPYYNPDPNLDPTWNDGDDIQPALELAKDQINNSSALLQNYTLQLVHAEGGCQHTPITVTNFVAGAFQESGRPVGLIGPGCSSSSVSLAPLTNRDKLAVVMLHGSGTPELSNRTRFPYSLGNLGTIDNFAAAYLYLTKEASWNRLAVLYDTSNVYFEETKRLVFSNATDAVKFLSPVSNTFIPLEAIKEARLRVIFVMCPLILSKQIICKSYTIGMTYNNFQWVFMDQTYNELAQPIAFEYDGISYNCSEDDMIEALEMATLLLFKLNTSSKARTISNLTFSEYLDHYEMYRERYNAAAVRVRNASFTVWASYLYDSVWAWALVLDNLTKEAADGNFLVNYGDTEQADRIVEQFYNIGFDGVSGEVNFTRENGFTIRKVDILQVKEGSLEKVAVSGTDGTMNVSRFISIPDTFPINARQGVIVGGISTVILTIQLLITIVAQILTAVYYKKPSIKASSPKLLHISYMGYYLVWIGIFTWSFRTALSAVIDNTLRHYFCQLLWAWCLPIGLIMAIGPVGMRTWRIYRIFKHYLDPGPLISNPILIGGVFLLLIPVALLAIVWTVVDPMRSEDEDEFRRGQLPLVKIQCNCKYYFVWLGSIMSYMVCVCLVVTIFGFLTRNIPNRTFATSALRVLMYIESLLLFIGLPIFYIINLVVFEPVYSYIVLAILLTLMLEVFFLCVFLPPLLPIFKLRWQKIKSRKTSVVSAASGVSYASSGSISPVSLYFKVT